MCFDLKGLRLLVVDHNADTRELFMIVFEEEGAEVMAVASAREALEALDRFKPDILLSELIMPGEDGYSLIRKVRSRKVERGDHIRAIAVTVAAKKEDRKRALLAGFHRHMSKPIYLDDLVATVAILSGRKELLCLSAH